MEEKWTIGKAFQLIMIDMRGPFQYEAIKITIIKQNLTFRNNSIDHDLVQLECSNNKCYISAFICI